MWRLALMTISLLKTDVATANFYFNTHRVTWTDAQKTCKVPSVDDIMYTKNHYESTELPKNFTAWTSSMNRTSDWATFYGCLDVSVPSTDIKITLNHYFENSLRAIDSRSVFKCAYFCTTQSDFFTYFSKAEQVEGSLDKRIEERSKNKNLMQAEHDSKHDEIRDFCQEIKNKIDELQIGLVENLSHHHSKRIETVDDNIETLLKIQSNLGTISSRPVSTSSSSNQIRSVDFIANEDRRLQNEENLATNIIPEDTEITLMMGLHIVKRHLKQDKGILRLKCEKEGYHFSKYFDHNKVSDIASYGDKLAVRIGLTIDSNGNAYVCGYESNTAVKISPDGKSHQIVLREDDGIIQPYDLDYNKSTQEIMIINDDHKSINIYKL
ncbi:unnamed protein product [Mytilus coruscus]|uniref:Uncharacterized protein n=1 Tax=Mytilus coruscus TaxID=42192 RepID=A0A6J8C522_MYTCO|nr:unnamed protein product [Mytilus coruscus]